MSLDNILLGMLWEPASGYDLGREFDRSARMFWFAELSQIYPTLRRMERAGLLKSRMVPSSRGPERRLYERTEAGTARLHEWLRQPPRLKRARLEHVAQIFFLGELGDLGESARALEALRTELGAQIATYEAIEERLRLTCGDPREIPDDEFHRQATLRAGIQVARARLAWCEETLAEVRRRRAKASAADDRTTAGPAPETAATASGGA